MEKKTTGTVPFDETDNLPETPRQPGDSGSDSGPGPESAPEEEGGRGPLDTGEKDDFFPDEGIGANTETEEEPIRSALPVLPSTESLEVYQEPSPTAWRGSAMTHAGAALLGAAVALGAVAATVGLSPKPAPAPPANNQIAQAAPDAAGINGAGINGPAGVNGAGINGAAPGSPNGLTPLGGTTAGVVPPGATPPGVPNGEVPPGMDPTMGTVPPGPPVNMMVPPNGRMPSRMIAPRFEGPGPMLPRPNFNLPPLTPPKTGPATGLPTLPPGFANSLAGRPPLVNGQPPHPNMMKPGVPASTKPKGPTPPPLKANPNGKPTPAAAIPPAPATPPPPAETGNMDQAIASAQKSVDAHPNDPVNYLQLEKLYRRKLIQADRVDEMERYRNLAEQAHEKAKNLLTNDKPVAPTPEPPANTEPKPSSPSVKPPQPSGSTESKPTPTPPVPDDKSSAGGSTTSSGGTEPKAPG